MRHKVAGYKLGRNTAHRRSLLRNLVTSVIAEERIETTVPKAKAARPLVEKMTDDVRRALKQNPALRAGTIQDGAHEMWNRTREGMQTLRESGIRAVLDGSTTVDEVLKYT